MTAEIRRASHRFTDREPGRATWHSFSFGPHYDPERLAFGPMVCHDEHLLGRDKGFATHPHSGLDIVTWVVNGALEHTDSIGGSHTIGPGQVGLLRAGSGVEHSEVAAAPQTRFVQVWLTPLDPDLPPAYDVRAAEPGQGRFAEVLRLAPARALHAARLEAGQSVTLPEAARRHLFVVGGALTRSSLAEPLAAGDSLLLTPGEGGEDSEGGEGTPVSVSAAVPTDVLLWELEE
ncbi:pirin family protein [Nocardioides insulae]|uniref:pirin family protein n=1 Tax=Nocardioides insulae TaxID=394734 RepID=UPI0003F58C0F|nr:pirin family protein [Nocardioides insulae]